MEKFLMLVREDLKEREKRGPEHFDNCVRMCSEWIESLVKSGNHLVSEPLTGNGSYVTREQVLSCTDTGRLEGWVDRAATAATIQEVLGS